MERNRTVAVVGIAVIAVVAVTLFSGFTGQVVDVTDVPEPQSFGECITEMGAKFYGAFWCSHCNDQKNILGDEMENVNYIECSTPDGKAQTGACRDAGIRAYPTWEFQDGTRLESVLTLRQLSAYTGCILE